MKWLKNLSILGNSLSRKRLNIIAIQGGSCSGKSTIAEYLHNQLNSFSIPNTLIGLDNYYKTFPGDRKNIGAYDFDNPAAFNWTGLKSTLNAYINRYPIVPHCTYDKDEMISRTVYKPNVYPKVILIEGIFAFNLINDLVFNIDEFDDFNSNKVINKEYIENEMNLENCSILKIMLYLDKNKMMEVRAKRDLRTGHATVEESRHRFITKIWPGTERWVYSPVFRPDIVLEGGSFNIEKSTLLTSKILEIYDCFDGKESFKEKIAKNGKVFIL